MQVVGNRISLTYSDVPFIGYNTIKSLCTRNQVERATRACKGVEATFYYDSFPLRYREMIKAVYPNIEEMTKKDRSFVSRIKEDEKAREFFRNYIVSEGRHLPQDKQDEYVANASVLNAIKEMMEETISARKGKKMKIQLFWSKVSSYLPSVAAVWQHSLPEYPSRLRDRYKLYLSQGYESLIHKGFCNKSAALVVSEEQQSLLMILLGDRRNLDNEQVRALYNTMAKKMEWAEISTSTVANWREKYELNTFAGRRGENAFNNVKAMQHRRSRPSSAMLMWSADGWDVELLYQKTTTDKKGHSVTTYSNRLNVVVVLDVCCDYPVGYAIGDYENPDLIREALKNAVNHTKALFGERLRACQFQSDRYAIKALMPTYQAIGDKVVPAQVKNAKAKPVERFFLSINKRYCQLMPNWSGFGVTSRKESQPNIDQLNKMRASFPDEQGCREQIARIMEMERARKREAYMKLYANLTDEHRLVMSTEDYLLEFGETTGYTNALQGNGLMPKIEGQRYVYDCFDLNFRKLGHIKWSVRYDKEDMTQALAVSENGEYRFMLEEKYVQPMALADRKECDALQLARVNAFNKAAKETIADQLCEAQERVLDLFNENPQIDQTLSKLILVDSQGQHKNQRNRLKAAKVDEIEEASYEVVEVAEAPKETKKISYMDIY
jgi:hypothetical protein